MGESKAMRSSSGPVPLKNGPEIPMNTMIGGERPTLGRRAIAQWATDRLSVIISTMSRANFSSEEIEELIANDGADPNVLSDRGITLLMRMSIIGQYETESVLRDNLLRTFTFLLNIPTINVKTVVGLGCVLIHLVAVMKDPIFLSLLLEKRQYSRLDINTLSHSTQGKATLHFACGDSNVSVENIQRLLMYGADPNMQCGENGRTPLQYLMVAYALCDEEVNKLIAILNAFFENPETRIGDPKLKDHFGQTLLHYAVRYRLPVVVINMLLRKGEYKSIGILEQNMGNTPMQVADRQGNTGAIEAMERFAAMRLI
jgi:hypothetical protein